MPALYCVAGMTELCDAEHEIGTNEAIGCSG